MQTKQGIVAKRGEGAFRDGTPLYYYEMSRGISVCVYESVAALGHGICPGRTDFVHVKFYIPGVK